MLLVVVIFNSWPYVYLFECVNDSNLLYSTSQLVQHSCRCGNVILWGNSDHHGNNNLRIC